MVIAQGDVWWADLGEPVGSQPGYRRPIIIVQSDQFNQSRISTLVCVPLSSNVKRANFPGFVLISARETMLPHDSVANAAHVMTIDRVQLIQRVGRLSKLKIAGVFAALDAVFGR